MKGFISIVAASAVLSAGLVAGLASADATPVRRDAAAVPAATPSAWIDPPTKAETACRDAAWPYRPTACAAEVPIRKVRVIAVDGTGALGAIALR